MENHMSLHNSDTAIRGSFLGNRFRERVFLWTGFPVIALIFTATRVILFSHGGFLPFEIILFLALLAFMEFFVSYEIGRTNWALGTAIKKPPRPWFTSHFWSWEGVKERTTSYKSWLAIAYVFVSFFITSTAIWLLINSFLAFIVLLFALGIFGLHPWIGSFVINEPDMSGKVRIILDESKIQFLFTNFNLGVVSTSEQVTWSYTSGWTILACLVIIFVAQATAPFLAQTLKDLVAYLIGAQSVEEKVITKVEKWSKKEKKK